MRIIRAFPPLYTEIAAHFPIKGRTGILFAWGDRIYNPSGVKLQPWIIEHEKVHGLRQLSDTSLPTPEDSVRKWWTQYIQSPQFRIQEEVPAHQAEWEAFSSQGAMRHEDQAHYLEAMIDRLSGPLYGSLVSKQEAENYILKRRFA